jgi:hypothetical protein
MSVGSFFVMVFDFELERGYRWISRIRIEHYGSSGHYHRV